jgi:predicted ATP-binding protein involved in virulence
MQIDELYVENFKSFGKRRFQFHAKFNLIVGSNGAGKTSALDALAIAVGTWFLGVRGADSRHIRQNEVTLKDVLSAGDEGDVPVVTFEKAYPCVIESCGFVQSERCTWRRTLNGPDSRTTFGEAKQVKRIATETDAAVRNGTAVSLPLISYYGTGRLWQEPKDNFQVSEPTKISDKEEQSRFAGYWNSVDPRLSVAELTRWIARQTWISFQKKGVTSPLFEAVRLAMIKCISGAVDLYFDPDVGEVIVRMENKSQPFSNLSDGQRSMLAMVGDLAQKAARLNPHLGARVLTDTKGIVLIDELDLHLHPIWQRRIVSDLMLIFPGLQFICTTHSPFVIQSMSEGRIIKLDDGGEESDAVIAEGDSAARQDAPVPICVEEQAITSSMENLGPVSDRSIEDIVEDIQGVEMPQRSERHQLMLRAAEEYFVRLNEIADKNHPDMIALKDELDRLAIPFGDDPAFTALLKFERDRLARASEKKN